MSRRKRLTFWGADQNDDSLVCSVMDGRKTVTADTVEDYYKPYGEYGDGSYEAGDLIEVFDQKQRLRCIIKATKVYTIEFGSVPEEVCRGETFSSAKEFQECHIRCLPNLDLHDRFELVTLHFELVEVIERFQLMEAPMPSILITGCSSGFGLETAKLFLDRGWNVVATMRAPREDLLPNCERLRVLPLDIADSASITQAVSAAGPIDVLVNNAGFGAPAPVELTAPETIRSLFETNAIGTLAMTLAVLPQFRLRRSGVIINVSSTATLRPLPMVGVYRASKAAVNAFTESLAAEVGPLGVRVHIVLPGRSPETRFGSNARPHLRGLDNPDYAPLIRRFMASVQESSGPVTHAPDVAAAIWRAATDSSAPLRIPAGADAEAWMAEAV